ncbi:MAG: protein kinase [Pseudomonadota bacterium]
MTAQLTINAGQYSDKGIKEQNQDACGIRIPKEPLLTSKGIACVIADGVSSSAGGREASESCVTGFLADYFSTPESWTVKTSGQRILGALNRWLHGQGQTRYASDHGMLTTCSALIIKSTTAHLFHIGDSRIYRYRDNDLECLTRDHQTWGSGDRRFLSRAMGADLMVEIDYHSLPVVTGDIFLLCTDGIHEFIDHKALTQLVAGAAENLERAARQIVTRALELGSQDNVTCQLVQITQLPLQDVDEFYHQLAELPFPPPLDAGMVLDGYKILRELHASTRTQIYLAQDIESGAQVIIKTPSVNYQDDASYIDRFMHEEWIGRRLSSPHVLKALEPKQRRRFLYYVTEYVEGQTLRQWMHDHPQPGLPQVRAIIEQLAAGLRAFHRMEMIHQDVKPENVMIDAHGTVKIIDFGSTRIAGIDEIAKPLEVHHLLGTANYTAPEYFRNERGNTRSDIYALGVICYEMLTGKLPYGEEPDARDFQRRDYIPSRTYRPEIPRWVDGAIATAVHKKPAQRYEHLSEFVYDLTHPNQKLGQPQAQPLIERNPLAFWRGLSALLFILDVVLIYLLSR